METSINKLELSKTDTVLSNELEPEVILKNTELILSLIETNNNNFGLEYAELSKKISEHKIIHYMAARGITPIELNSLIGIYGVDYFLNTIEKRSISDSTKHVLKNSQDDGNSIGFIDTGTSYQSGESPSTDNGVVDSGN